MPKHIVVGAGTVLTPGQVDEVVGLGGSVIISPNCDPDVIGRTVALGAVSLPGVATPTEAFLALKHGATGIKAFPGEHLPSGVLKAWRAVLPKGSQLFAVGGVGANNMAEYWRKGISGFGIGSSLYAPGTSAEEVRRRAGVLVTAAKALQDPQPRPKM
eukprot:Hpha_TRINITY_DN14485_c2_g1::TRINITY_DN14485_c2_g1_i1::g.157957::m.157957/K01631/dgoA; 2-dehydro-3-deoxyphosphogalactonate aldolase